jgi:5'-AMP-activated protein kinase catalytic alpha subunit
MGQYEIIKTLGQGGTSKVKLGRDTVSGRYVAIKILNSQFLSQEFEQVQSEIDALSACNHPNIIRILDLMQDVDYVKPSGKSSKETALVLELAPNGELIEYVIETGRFTEPICRYIFKSLLQSLSHLHKKGYANRDLKPENIFLGENFTLKMADLGFSTLLKGKDGSGKLHTPLGTPGYVAPEILLQQPYNGVLTDLFALAVINFTLLSGYTPFQHAMKSDRYYGTFVSNKKFYW